MIARGGWLAQHEPVLRRVALGAIPVLLLGETGVGKDVVAGLIHQLSRREGKPMLRLNCAALPEQLLESELFGYERGAFTGAHRTKVGLLESADGGTVFLDEVGELPLATQTKLLRVVETGHLMRLGGLAERSVDVRYIAATNRDLHAEAIAGRFRADLFYRFNAFTLAIPPLRERRGEIPALVMLFAEKMCAQLGRSTPTISRAARDAFSIHDWPGNVRELRNVVERALVLCDDTLDVTHLPEGLHRHHRCVPGPTTRQAAVSPMAEWDAFGPEAAPSESGFVRLPGQDQGQGQGDARSRVVDALRRCAGNQTQTAKALGISRRTLLARLDRYDIPRPRKARAAR